MRFPSGWIVRGNKGMALLITIMVVSLLIAVTVQFNRNVRQSYFASASQLEGRNLRTMARSGLTIGEALLEADGKVNGYDSLQDSWARPENLAFAGLFPRGELKLQVIDLSGRLQLNSLVIREGGSGQNVNETREILKRLLLSGTFELENDQKAQEIVDAIIDWLDADDEESDFGAEASYYRSLDPPYDCRNGPAAAIEELLLVKGITPQLLFGGQGRRGLADFLTVYGSDARININTAAVELLRALHPLMNEELVTVLDEYRRADENYERLERSDWYRNVPAWPGDIELPAENISTRSGVFRIRAEGRLHDQRQSMTAVVRRTNDNQTVEVERRAE